MNDKPNGNIALKPVTFVTLMLILIGTVISGIIYISTTLGEMNTRLNFVDREVTSLMAFRDKGGRFTQEDAKALEIKILALETEIRTYPPAWFREDFKELKADVKYLRSTIDENKAALLILENRVSNLTKSKLP
jgi:hypothetical protein